MKITQSFTFENAHGVKVANCFFRVNRYATTGNLALTIWDEEGQYTSCTVNGTRKNGDFEIGIKDYSENEGMVEFLQKMGIIENDPVDAEQSGFIVIPYYKLTESGKELYTEFLANEK